jgi:hypothetical protein
MTLAEALRNHNVQAFLRMLRHGEGTTALNERVLTAPGATTMAFEQGEAVRPEAVALR